MPRGASFLHHPQRRPFAGAHAAAGLALLLCCWRCWRCLLVSDRCAGSLGYAMFITAIAVIGLQICTGYAGQVNLGQSAFMGVGAYACALFLHLPQMPLLLALLLGGCVPRLRRLLFGLTAARIKGFYLALTTIAAQAIFHFLVLNLPGTGWAAPVACTSNH
jgi:ABC-type branched-subunit amino acid transport system permease subunit